MKSKLNYNLLESSVMNIQNIALNLKLIMENISNRVKSIQTNEHWLGDASDYYQEQFSIFEINFTETYEQLKNYALLLSNIINNYKNIDKKILETIGLN